MAANGSHGNRYTLRDKLENVERGDIGGSSKLTDGYGSVWGAAKFWQNVNNFDTNSDLYKHSDYGGGTWSYLSNNESSTVLANDNNGFSGIHATSVEFCSDASTGKKSRVAELRAYGDSSSTTIDGKSYAGKVELVLYSFSNGRTRTLDTHLPVTVNTNMMYEGRLSTWMPVTCKSTTPSLMSRRAMSMATASTSFLSTRAAMSTRTACARL